MENSLPPPPAHWSQYICLEGPFILLGGLWSQHWDQKINSVLREIEDSNEKGQGWGQGGWNGGLQCQEPGEEEWHIEQKNFPKRHSRICEFGTPIPRNLTASQWKNLHCENGESKGEERVAGHALLPGATPSARNPAIQSPASTRFACTFHLPSSASSLLGIRYLNSGQHRFPSQVRTKDGNPLARRQSQSFFWVGDKNDWIGVSCLNCSGNLYPSPCFPASVSFSVPPVVSRISPLSVVSGPPLQVGHSVTIMRTRLALDRAAGQSSSSPAVGILEQWCQQWPFVKCFLYVRPCAKSFCMCYSFLSPS